ncbi:MAG TPA: Do family serine endopeptidase [Anaeromyxobacteraceae bacterium]|nr:Do family serine endopeptidase [Anaeromyxobacteraceae bacterium]
MRRVLSLSLVAAAAVAVTLACTRESRADAGAATAAAGQLWRELPATAAAAPTVPVTGGSLAPLVKQLKPAVVNIATTTVTKNHPRVPGYRGPQGGPGGQGGPMDEFFERFYGQPREMPEFRSNSLGSGFIINKDGYVLTNNHVVGDATEIKVKLSDGREFMAKVVGKDPPTDVALIRLEKAPHDLPTVALGDSDALEQGDFVLALGNPFGLSGSASFGMVSAKARTLQNGPFDDFIQTDAAINPGNSGGPLFNMKGEVVGINTAIVSPQIGQGIGFAVPINLAKQLLPQLEKGVKIARGYLGVTVGDLTPELARGFGLAEGTKGAVVQDVVAKGPAAKAGVKAGDVVVAVNGKPVEDRGQLTRAVAATNPGGKANLTLYRKGKKQEVAVTLGTRPDEDAIARGDTGEDGDAGDGDGAEVKGAKLGVRLQAVTPEMARQLKIEGEGGVLVAEVSPDGAAARAGLQRGDVILEVAQEAVSKPEQVSASVSKAKPGDVLLLRVKRGNMATYLPVKIPEPETPEKPDKKK